MVTADDVRKIAFSLPRAYEALVRDRIKFRVGRIVFVSLSPDETEMGFGYPKEERDALIASEPEKFQLPYKSDMRYNWVRVWLSQIDYDELCELVVDSWRMAVSKKMWEEYQASLEAGSTLQYNPPLIIRHNPAGRGRRGLSALISAARGWSGRPALLAVDADVRGTRAAGDTLRSVIRCVPSLPINAG